MSRRKLRIHQTPAEKIASDLRGEVGESIASWIMWRWIRAQLRALQTDDVASDLRDPDQNILSLLASRLHDDLVARIAELAAKKIGRVNFHFAATKLGNLEHEVDEFIRFVEQNRFTEKRNWDISHKELTASWDETKVILIRPLTVAKVLAMALRLMKKIDRIVIGPAAPYLWREMRKKRYQPMAPARAAYMLLPYLRLSDEDRVAVAVEEAREGEPMWEPLETEVNGEPRTVLVNKKWGLIRIARDEVSPLGEYPLQEITSITEETSEPDLDGT